MRARIAFACLIVVAVAAAALAHHVSGKVYCDKDGDGKIDVPDDTHISSITVRATSPDAVPGQHYSDGTGGSGGFYIELPARTDPYRDELINLPSGYTVVVPSGGPYVVHIIAGTSKDHVDGLKFLVQGCAPPKTTTTTTSTTSTTKKTTTTTSATTSTTKKTTTTTTTTSTTTTIIACECPTAFVVARDGTFNNDATIGGALSPTSPAGRSGSSSASAWRTASP